MKSNVLKNTPAKISVEWIVALFIVLALVAPFGIEVMSYLFLKNYVATIGVVLLVALCLWQSRLVNSMVINLTWEKLPLLLLFVWGGLSLFWAINADYAIGKWLLWLVTLLMFWLATRIKPDQYNLIKLSIGLVIAADIVAIIGAGQYLFDPNNYFLPQSSPPGSTFGNRNGAAQIMVLLFPLTLFLLFSPISKAKIWFTTLSMALILAYVFYTNARAAWLGVSIELVLIFGLLYWQRKNLSWIGWTRQKTTASIISLIIFLVLINFSSQGFISAGQTFGNEFNPVGAYSGATTSMRYKIWQAGINMIADAPWIGHGLGSFFHNMFSGGYATGTILSHNAHNDVVELFVELGVVGVLLLLSFIVAMLSIWKCLIVQQTIKQHWFYSLIIIALGGSFVNAMFSFPYQMAVPLMIFALFTGLFLKGTENYQHNFTFLNIKLSRTVKNSYTLVLSVVLLMVLVVNQNWMNVFLNINTNVTKPFSAEKFTNPKEFEMLVEQPEKLMLFDGLAKHYIRFNENNAAFNIIKMLQIAAPENGNRLMQTYQTKQSQTETANTYQQLKTLHANAVNRGNKEEVLYFYQQFVRYHGYDFSVEDDMAFFYASQQDYKNTAKHYKTIIKNNPEKANKKNIDFLIQQGLLPANALEK